MNLPRQSLCAFYLLSYILLWCLAVCRITNISGIGRCSSCYHVPCTVLPPTLKQVLLPPHVTVGNWITIWWNNLPRSKKEELDFVSGCCGSQVLHLNDFYYWIPLFCFIYFPHKLSAFFFISPQTNLKFLFMVTWSHSYFLPFSQVFWGWTSSPLNSSFFNGFSCHWSRNSPSSRQPAFSINSLVDVCLFLCLYPFASSLWYHWGPYPQSHNPFCL